MRVGRLLKNALNFTDQKKLPKLDLDMIQNQIGDKVFVSLNRTFSERQSDLDNSHLTVQELEELINQYSKQNMAIALSSGLIPGPLGIFSAVPELVMTMKNQMAMIYDFSCGYDKESFINKDILLDIPIYALGGKTNLSVLQDRSNLTDSPEAILKSKALDLGKGLIERNLKKSLVKFIPIGGPLVMATWAKMSTQKIGAASKVFFDNNEHFVDQTPELPQSLETQLTVTKIKVMINLMEVDGDIHADEISFITPIIDHVDIPKSDKLALLEEAEKMGSELPLDLNLFRSYPNEADTLMMELCLLAKRDGSVHPEQEAYIQKIGEEIGHDVHKIEDLLHIDANFNRANQK